MSERAAVLAAMIDRQVSELLALLEACEESSLRRPCPGREKLGDGTIAAVCSHTGRNYVRIAEFVEGSEARAGDSRAHLRRIASSPRSGRDRHGPSMHGSSLTRRGTRRAALIDLIEASRGALGVVAGLSDEQLDAVPAADDAMRFCDGRRTLGEIIGALLKHQGHSVAALRGALA